MLTLCTPAPLEATPWSPISLQPGEMHAEMLQMAQVGKSCPKRSHSLVSNLLTHKVQAEVLQVAQLSQAPKTTSNV